jgi:hypothetical protein
MKALFLSTPDLDATRMANLLTPWCDAPIQCFQDMQTGVDRVDIGTLVDNLHQDIFLDAQKSWFQYASEGFNNIGEGRPGKWSASTFAAITQRDRWLISDSRLCLTAPFWQSNLKPEALVIAYSHPLVCALMLSKTWRFPISVGLALWEYYLLCAVNHCKNQTTIILSLVKFRHERNQFNRIVAKQLAKLGYAEDDSLEKLKSISSPIFSTVDASGTDPRDYLSDNQAGILAELEELDLEAVAKRSLSAQSQDLLLHYGDLRAGYEKLKLQRNQVQQELNAVNAAKPAPQAEEIQPKVATESSSDVQLDTANYVEVSVQVKDMRRLEFICSKDAPILNTLQEVLQNPYEYTDKLLFLNYGQNGDQSLYFPGCNLLSLNIVAI